MCSESVLKAARVGLSTRVGRRSGPGELVESPNAPVSFLLIVKEGNKGRPEVDGRGEGLVGDDGGLTARSWVDVAAARGGEGDRSLGV
jgi:hypothetical protein